MSFIGPNLGQVGFNLCCYPRAITRVGPSRESTTLKLPAWTLKSETQGFILSSTAMAPIIISQNLHSSGQRRPSQVNLLQSTCGLVSLLPTRQASRLKDDQSHEPVFSEHNTDKVRYPVVNVRLYNRPSVTNEQKYCAWRQILIFERKGKNSLLKARTSDKACALIRSVLLIHTSHTYSQCLMIVCQLV